MESQTTGGKSTEELKAEVQSRIDQIHATEQEQSAYLSSDDIAELEKMEALLQGSLTLLEQFEKTGAITMPETGSATNSGLIPNSAALKAGWNGNFDIVEGSGEYDEIIQPHNTGKDAKNALIYKASNGEEIVSENVGDDLKLTTILDGVEKTYLIKGMAKNKIPLVIAADQTTTGVTVNFAKAKLAGDLTILGGSGDDTLIGSQGSDKIYGNAGVDTIYGMGGVNSLYGGADADILTGGSGKDMISGDAGYDTIKKAKGDEPVNPEPDVSEIETKAFDKTKVKTTVWTKSEKADGTELVVSKDKDTKDGGTIDITIPNGYMTYGKKDGDDLVLVMQQLNDDGTPTETQEVLRLKGFLAANNKTTLKLISESEEGSPNMVDLGGINVRFNTVVFEPGKGSDVFVKHTTEFDTKGIDKNDLGKPTLTNKATKDIKEEWMKDDDFKKTLKENSTTQSGGTITLTPKADTENLDIPSPDGYTQTTQAVVQSDKDGYTVTMFIKDDKSGDTQRLVIHVIKTGDNPQNILIDGQDVIEVND
jgi:hypothetical protein